jgi:AcrR family transcriptional regulator
VLASTGYAGFTLRRVAAAAGITVGNLSYHFTSRQDLLRSVIARMVQEYSKQMTVVFEKSVDEHDGGLSGLVAWLIRDSTTPETIRLGREIWAMSLHDAYVAEAMDKFYLECIGNIAALVQHRYPQVLPARARAIAALVIMVAEGANVLYGTSTARKSPVAQVTQMAAEALVSLTDCSRGDAESNRQTKR